MPFGLVPLLQVGHGQVIGGESEARIELDGFFPVLDGLVIPDQDPEGAPQIILKICDNRRH
jgi:hypothetical protein